MGCCGGGYNHNNYANHNNQRTEQEKNIRNLASLFMIIAIAVSIYFVLK